MGKTCLCIVKLDPLRRSDTKFNNDKASVLLIINDVFVPRTKLLGAICGPCHEHVGTLSPPSFAEVSLCQTEASSMS